MLAQLPRLTMSLRCPFHPDQADLRSESALRPLHPPRSDTYHGESMLLRKIVPLWGEASGEVRQAYRQFCVAVAELIDGEFLKEEFEEVAKAVYRAFQGLGKNAVDVTKIAESKGELLKVIGYHEPDVALERLLFWPRSFIH